MEPSTKNHGGIVYADADSSGSSDGGGPTLLELQNMRRKQSHGLPAIDEKPDCGERKSGSNDTRGSSQVSMKLFKQEDLQQNKKVLDITNQNTSQFNRAAIMAQLKNKRMNAEDDCSLSDSASSKSSDSDNNHKKMTGKLLIKPVDHTKKSLNMAPLANSLLTASEEQKAMARSNNSYWSRRSQSSAELQSGKISSKELFETRSGECLRPLLKEPGTAMGLKNKYKFGAACLFVDDSKAVLKKLDKGAVNSKAKKHMLQKVGPRPDLAKIIEENKSGGTMSASDGSFRKQKKSLNKPPQVAQASAFMNQEADDDASDVDQDDDME